MKLSIRPVIAYSLRYKVRSPKPTSSSMHKNTVASNPLKSEYETLWAYPYSKA